MPHRDRPPPEEYSSIVTIPTPEIEDILRADCRFEALHRSHPGTSSQPIRQQSDAGILSQSAPGGAPKPQLQRGHSQIQQALAGSARFVGIPYDEDDAQRERSRWDSKRLRFLNRRYKISEQEARDEGDGESVAGSHALSTLHPSTPGTAESINGQLAEPSSAASTSSNFFPHGRSTSVDSRRGPRVDRRDSVIRTFYDHVTSFMKRGTTVRKSRHVPLVALKSFDVDAGDEVQRPSIINSHPTPVDYGTVIDHDTSSGDVHRRSQYPVIAEETSTEVEDEKLRTPSVRYRDDGTVVIERPTLRALADASRSLLYVTPETRDTNFTQEGAESNLDQREDKSGSEQKEAEPTSGERGAESDMEEEPHFLESGREIRKKLHPRYRRHCFMQIRRGPNTLSDEVFFDITSATGLDGMNLAPKQQAQDIDTLADLAMLSTLDMGDGSLNQAQGRLALGGDRPESIPERIGRPDRASFPPFQSTAFVRPSLRRQTSIDHPEEETEEGGDQVDHTRRFMDGVLDFAARPGVIPRSAPRTRGIGLLGRLMQRQLGKKKVAQLPAAVKKKIEEGEDERPFFTYWVTTVQILICAMSIVSYGIGPWALERVERKDEVMDTSSSLRQVSFYEPTNIWIGPAFANLILLGAKYSPCMRREKLMWEQIERDRERENRTGCCVFNDRSGCYQTGQTSCPLSIATWIKWRPPRRTLKKSKSDSDLLRLGNTSSFLLEQSSPVQWPPASHRLAGAVCGQDPEWCARPPSVGAHKWPDDLTRWPICQEQRSGDALPAHMTCQVTGRPCCIQLQGQCRIATKEYCTFVQGHWHENATLCSQVDCFSDICGMLPFLTKDHPNQFYRLFTSIFLHAGILHLVFSVAFQWYLMRDLEKMIGWLRMAILYIGSGIGGNLASAIFVPYNQETGPSGSQLGIMAALLVDVYHHRRIIQHWRREMGYNLVIVGGLFIMGLMPWIDNWAHIFGFVFGLLITIVTFPYMDFSTGESRMKRRGAGCLRNAVSVRYLVVGFSLLACVLLFFLLSYVFYSNIQWDWPIFEYLNCINIKMFTSSDHFCDNKGHRLSQWLPI